MIIIKNANCESQLFVCSVPSNQILEFADIQNLSISRSICGDYIIAEWSAIESLMAYCEKYYHIIQKIDKLTEL